MTKIYDKKMMQNFFIKEILTLDYKNLNNSQFTI